MPTHPPHKCKPLHAFLEGDRRPCKPFVMEALYGLPLLFVSFEVFPCPHPSQSIDYETVDRGGARVDTQPLHHLVRDDMDLLGRLVRAYTSSDHPSALVHRGCQLGLLVPSVAQRLVGQIHCLCCILGNLVGFVKWTK